MANPIIEFNTNLDSLLEYTMHVCPTCTTEFMDIKRKEIVVLEYSLLRKYHPCEF